MKQTAYEQGKPVSPSIFVRWGGVAAVLGGPLFAVWGYIHRDDAPRYFDIIANALAFVVPLLFLIGLAGLYARCKARVGWIGGTGFTLGFVGSAWGATYSIIDTSLWYTFWRTYAPGNGWITLLLDWLNLLLVGLVLIGIGAIVTKVFQGWGALLLIMGFFGWAYRFTDSPGGIVELRSVHIVFGILFSVSWVVLGHRLWLGRRNDLVKASKRG